MARPWNGKLNISLILTVLILLLVGNLMVFSSSYVFSMSDGGSPYDLILSHLKYTGIGLTMMLVPSLIDYRKIKKFSFLLFVFALVLCSLVFTSLGTEIYTARRWLKIGSYTLMPSDVMKFAAVAFAANFLTYNRENVKTFWKGFVPYLFIIATSVGLVYLQPDLSTIVVIVLSLIIMFVVAGMNLLYSLPVIGLGGLGFFYAIFKSNSEYSRIARLTAYLNPLEDFKNTGWQLSQSLFAVSTGSLFGLGLGKSRQKFHYLSEAYNDFIFAIICEELGFVGAVLIVGLYTAFIFQGVRIAIGCKDRYGKLLATGLTMTVGLQAFFNMGVAIGLVPPTGLVLPFISYGGSSLVITLAMVGVLLNISKQT